mmetsp:Transcript_12475/g.24236  ORF Transcript_12475/g.24236 Transcript_12475/m.24236 type:complete len:340 (+) Transcript_12475:676-1695(+)
MPCYLRFVLPQIERLQAKRQNAPLSPIHLYFPRSSLLRRKSLLPPSLPIPYFPCPFSVCNRTRRRRRGKRESREKISTGRILNSLADLIVLSAQSALEMPQRENKAVGLLAQARESTALAFFVPSCLCVVVWGQWGNSVGNLKAPLYVHKHMHIFFPEARLVAAVPPFDSLLGLLLFRLPAVQPEGACLLLLYPLCLHGQGWVQPEALVVFVVFFFFFVSLTSFLRGHTETARPLCDAVDSIVFFFVLVFFVIFFVFVLIVFILSPCPLILSREPSLNTSPQLFAAHFFPSIFFWNGNLPPHLETSASFLRFSLSPRLRLLVNGRRGNIAVSPPTRRKV